MGVSINEQETVIHIPRVPDGEWGATVWTNDTRMMTKLNRLCESSPENYKLIERGKAVLSGELLDARYGIADRKLLTFRSGKPRPEMTPEQKEQMRERMRAMLEKQRQKREEEARREKE